MNEDIRVKPVSLRSDRYTKRNTVYLLAVTGRLKELLENPEPGSIEWRLAYRTNVCDFLELFNATTPDLPCNCGKGG